MLQARILCSLLPFVGRMNQNFETMRLRVVVNHSAHVHFGKPKHILRSFHETVAEILTLLATRPQLGCKFVLNFIRITLLRQLLPPLWSLARQVPNYYIRESKNI